MKNDIAPRCEGDTRRNVIKGVVRYPAANVSVIGQLFSCSYLHVTELKDRLLLPRGALFSSAARTTETTTGVAASAMEPTDCRRRRQLEDASASAFSGDALLAAAKWATPSSPGIVVVGRAGHRHS